MFGTCYTMDGGHRKHSRAAIQERRLTLQYFAAETKKSIWCMFVRVWTHPIFFLDVLHKLCDGTNEKTVFERRRNQLAQKLNDAAMALIEGAVRRWPSEASSLVELETRIDELCISLAAE